VLKQDCDISVLVYCRLITDVSELDTGVYILMFKVVRKQAGVRGNSERSYGTK